MKSRFMQMMFVLVPGLLSAVLVPADAGDAVHVTINDLVFSPAVVTVKVGDSVVFDNRDFLDHTATSDSGKLDVVLPAQTSAETVMHVEGTFQYICRYHPNMTGEIRVTGK